MWIELLLSTSNYESGTALLLMLNIDLNEPVFIKERKEKKRKTKLERSTVCCSKTFFTSNTQHHVYSCSGTKNMLLLLSVSFL